MSSLNQNTLIGNTPIGAGAHSIFDSLLVAKMFKHLSAAEFQHWFVNQSHHWSAVISTHWRVVFHGRGDI